MLEDSPRMLQNELDKSLGASLVAAVALFLFLFLIFLFLFLNLRKENKMEETGCQVVSRCPGGRADYGIDTDTDKVNDKLYFFYS